MPDTLLETERCTSLVNHRPYHVNRGITFNFWKHSYLNLKSLYYFCNFLKHKNTMRLVFAHCCVKLSFLFDSFWPELSSLGFFVFVKKTTALVPIYFINQLCTDKPWWQFQLALPHCRNGCRFPPQFIYITYFYLISCAYKKALVTSSIVAR